MPRRPIQHQLEDISRNKLESCIPKKEWLIRDKGKDYGVDCEVELFDGEGYATGILFYVQLKATSSNNETQIYNVDFKIDTLEYFKDLDILNI
ncbi:DUF4365 domain-containing protein [Tenacibaculum ovolyticum]|uniref:DUF4365 domain-containing protein n=1 Tax=Tenacibaculum ovolyticum TaxID=104270 RepID=UPI003BA99D14